MIDKEEFFVELARIFNKDADAINENTRFREDLNAKSVSYFAIAAVVEETWGLELTYALLRKFDTVGGVLDYIESALKESRAQ